MTGGLYLTTINANYDSAVQAKLKELTEKIDLYENVRTELVKYILKNFKKEIKE